MSSTFGCPHCGQGNPIDAAFCAGCGTNLQQLDTGLLSGDSKSNGDSKPNDDTKKGDEPTEGGENAESAASKIERSDQSSLSQDTASQDTASQGTASQETAPQERESSPNQAASDIGADGHLNQTSDIRKTSADTKAIDGEILPEDSPNQEQRGEDGSVQNDAEQSKIKQSGADQAGDSVQKAVPNPALPKLEEDVDQLLNRLLGQWAGAIRPMDTATLDDIIGHRDVARLQQTQPTASRDEKSDEKSDEERRQLRSLINEDVPLIDLPDVQTLTDSGSNSLGNGGPGIPRIPWIGWLAVLVLVGSILLGQPTTNQIAHAWPGLEETYTVINQLTPDDVVLINWAYDPATAGEMDRVAQPVVAHLLARRSRLAVVSQLPGGPASARRLIQQASTDLLPQERLRLFDTALVEGGFLPGGPASLALVGQTPTQGISVDVRGAPTEGRQTIDALTQQPPALALVFAAQAESVQRWLEQVQPLNDVPTIAITSAGADPILRPYLDSGQLVGLVSGYSGGQGYQRRTLRAPDPQEATLVWQRTNARNWIFFLLVVVVLLGNLANQPGSQNGSLNRRGDRL